MFVLTALLVKMKILPEDPAMKPDILISNVLSNIPIGMEFKGKSDEPIAFGLVAVIAGFIIPDEEGMIDKLEEVVNSVDSVSQVEVKGVSRISASLK